MDGQYWDINIDVAFKVNAEICPTEEEAREVIWALLSTVSRLSESVIAAEPTETLFVGEPEESTPADTGQEE